MSAHTRARNAGLWFGSSLLTLAEFFEFFADLIALKCKHQSKGKVKDAEKGNAMRGNIVNGAPVRLKPIDKSSRSGGKSGKTKHMSQPNSSNSSEHRKNNLLPSYDSLSNRPKSGKEPKREKDNKVQNDKSKTTAQTIVEKFEG